MVIIKKQIQPLIKLQHCVSNKDNKFFTKTIYESDIAEANIGDNFWFGSYYAERGFEWTDLLEVIGWDEDGWYVKWQRVDKNYNVIDSKIYHFVKE